VIKFSCSKPTNQLRLLTRYTRGAEQSCSAEIYTLIPDLDHASVGSVDA